jgi:3-dehydroquinate dehydratase
MDEMTHHMNQCAQRHELEITQRHSNYEGQIVDWLLSTTPGDRIILNWNGRLADSATVVRALSSIQASVILVTPLETANLGPLPPCIHGVIAGTVVSCRFL